jgi:hypothetical protein
VLGTMAIESDDDGVPRLPNLKGRPSPPNE